MTERRIHAVQAVAAPATATGAPVEVKVKTHLWLTWARIAIRQEKLARSARAELEARTAEQGWNLATELEPAMIAIAAVTHAIDGFAGDVEPIGVPQELRDRWASNRTHSRGPIMETLKHAFDIGGSATAWRAKLDDLFELLRHPALHHRPKFRDTVPHTTLPTNVGPEYVDYAIENVEIAVDFMLEVFEACIEAPKKQKPEVAEWANALRRSLNELAADRSKD